MTEKVRTSSYSLNSSKSSRDTLDDDKYTDIKYVIQEEPLTIVLPVDSTEFSENSLLFYIRYIHKIGNMVHVLYVSEDLIGNRSSENLMSGEEQPSGCCAVNKHRKKKKVVVEVGPSPGVLKELEHEMKREYHIFKRKVKKYFRTNGVLFEFHRLISNDPAKAISLFAKQTQAKMIVIGSRPKSTFKSTFMGSVSRRVIGMAEMPVLVVKSQLNKARSGTAIN